MVNIPYRNAELVNNLAWRVLEKPPTARDLAEACQAVGRLNYHMDPSWLARLEQRLERAQYGHRDAGQLLRACTVLRYRMPEAIVQRVMQPVMQVPGDHHAVNGENKRVGGVCCVKLARVAETEMIAMMKETYPYKNHWIQTSEIVQGLCRNCAGIVQELCKDCAHHVSLSHRTS